MCLATGCNNKDLFLYGYCKDCMLNPPCMCCGQFGLVNVLGKRCDECLTHSPYCYEGDDDDEEYYGDEGYDDEEWDYDDDEEWDYDEYSDYRFRPRSP